MKVGRIMALSVIKKCFISSLMVAMIMLVALQAVLRSQHSVADSPSQRRKWFTPTTSTLSESTTMAEDDRADKLLIYRDVASLDKQENGNFAYTDSARSPGAKPGLVNYKDVASLDKQENKNSAYTESGSPEAKPGIVTFREVESLDNQKVSNNEPMVLGLKYSEQISHALGSLLDLQCWAKSVNITKVVEPSVKAFSYRALHFLPEDKKALQLRELFDINHWNNMSLRHGYSPLVSLEYFLQYATREVVYVKIVYRDQHRSCNSLDTTSRVTKEKWFKYLQVRGFHITKMVCIDFTQKVTTERIFRDKIFQNADRLSVIFDTWRGIRVENNGYRIPLKYSHCIYCLRIANVELSASKVSNVIYSHRHISKPPIIHSRRILKYADQFISEFLSNEKYVVVMLRTEKTSSSIVQTQPRSNSCVKAILADWEEMVKAKNLSKTLLFSDAGGHGSLTLHSSPATHFSQYIQNALHVDLSLNRVNTYFETITSSDDSVQIAVLEQELAVRATCVIVLGEGLFQQQTLNMYAHKHRGQECYVVRDPQCRPHYIRRVYDAFQ